MPEIGDPFPVSDILQPIAEAQNAFPIFKRAIALWIETAEEDNGQFYAEATNGWDPIDKQLNKYLELNRPALETWREAAEKDDYQYVPIAQAPDMAYFTNIGALRDLNRLNELQIERLTETGRPIEARPWLRASFRSSVLLTRNSTWIDRQVGFGLFAMSVEPAVNWTQHPDVTSRELLELLAVVQQSDPLMEKPSTTVKIEPLITRQERANWSYAETVNLHGAFGNNRRLPSRFEMWLCGEPELSHRLTAQLTANHLPFVDASRRERPPILGGDVFDESAAGVVPIGRLPGHELAKHLTKSRLMNAADRSLIAGFLIAIDRQDARCACLQVALAAQAYYRDLGEFPARLEDLQPDYLTSLPDDPYSARPAPVILRRTGIDAVVYSRFSNEIDDGGVVVAYAEAPDRQPRDFGIRIRRPEYPPVVAPRP